MARPKNKPAQRFSGSALRAIVDMAAKNLVDPIFRTQIGQLHLMGLRQDGQPDFPSEFVSAARHWADFVGFHDRVVGNPSRTVKSPDYQMGRAGKGEGGDHQCRSCDCGGDKVLCPVISRVKSQWSDAVEAIGPEWRVVYDTVILDHHCPPWERDALKRGLCGLAVLYGYVKRKAA
jgi:hypothetical protein